MNIDDQEDRDIPGQLTAAITVNWAQPRAWHGDIVTIRVRTNRVPDGYNVQLRIFPDGVNNHFDQVPNQPIADNKLDFDYTLDWKTKLPQPAPYPALFRVEAAVIALNINALSDTLAVDLIPPLFSA